MDFFRNCKTNIHQADNIWKTSFSRYNAPLDRKAAYQLLAELRKQDAFCTYCKNELYIFGGKPSETVVGKITEHGTPVIEDATLESHTVSRTADGIREVLLEAIYETIGYRLMQYTGGNPLRLGAGQWLLEDEGEWSGGVLLRLRLSVTDAGVLSACTDTVPATLAPCEEAVPGQSVVLAPSGIKASIAGRAGKSVIESEDWKELVIAILESEGVMISSEDEWLLIELDDVGAQSCFVWPARLCLSHSDNAQTARNAITAYDWRHYFAASEDDNGFKHPLAIAEDWFTGAAEREKAVLGVTQAHNGAANGDLAVPATSASDNAGLPVTSPPFNQRTADQQAAMSGIYPTPPDGRIPGQPASQQPSSDNVMDGTMQNDSHSFGNEFLPGSSDGLDQQRQHTSSSDPPTYQRQNDDLFGDMDGDGEMDFGGGAVGDEDFDFFNDGDEAPVEQEATEAEDAETVEAEPTCGVQAAGHGLPVEQESHDDAPHEPHLAEATQTPAAAAPAEAETSAVSRTPAAQEIDEAELLSAPTPYKDPGAPEPEKPLSPFTIKERLLPPPIPASARSGSETPSASSRRSSTFEAMSFRDGLDLGHKWSEYGMTDSYVPTTPSTSTPISTSLPTKQKKPRHLRVKPALGETPEVWDTVDSESEEDSFESESSDSDEDLPPKTPFGESRKRKRSEFEAAVREGELGAMLGYGGDGAEKRGDDVGADGMEVLLGPLGGKGLGYRSVLELDGDREESFGSMSEDLAPVEQVLKLSKLDLVYTAQLLSEQAVSCVPSITKELDILTLDHNSTAATATALSRLSNDLLGQLILDTASCEITKLALVREPMNRPVPNPVTKPGQPKPPQRADSVNLGPDIMTIPPPYVRVQRGNDTYEMLPPALDFWETLSLAPTNGAKDVRAFCVFPLNEDLQRLIDTFLRELGTVYESCKLGSHQHIRNVDEENERDEFEDGLSPVELGDDENLGAAVKAYSETCVQLGHFLATVAHLEAERTIVVYMLNPFPYGRAMQHLCACFWLLCKTYREASAKAHRNQPRSDIVLQILPVELIAAPDGLVTLDAKQLAALAKEVYDRCPPSPYGDHDASSALPNYAAPFVELASPPPKRIGFQLTAEPPSDLLHEGSSLHMAYSLSGDGKWITVVWVDTTGRYQSSTSFCLCGRSFADAVVEIWDRTRKILAAREVTWRVFIVTASEVDESIKRCWRRVVEKTRKQPFSVTLLTAQLEPELKMMPPPLAEDGQVEKAASGAGFLTPGSTPQSILVTVSPDGGGHNAPPTPAPSDSVAAIAENDPDAHLIDLADESWGVLLSPSATSSQQKTAQAHGALYKRGAEVLEVGRPGAELPSLGLSVLWTVQIRPTGNVDEGNVRQSEMTLREVLKMYRNLSILTRARGLAGGHGGGECLPIHLAAAVSGAKSLSGFLGTA